MIIRGYSTKQFAGLKNLELKFDENLNVVLGPNEAGKSTIVNGMVSTLFNTIRVGDRTKEDKEFKRRFMPHPEGDFIDGSVHIAHGDEEYVLRKEWGATPEVSLVMPDGSIKKDEGSIEDIMKELLVFGEETYRRIVFAKQEELKDAVQRMTSHNGTNVEIGDFLRRTVMELDGVSLDELEGKINDQLEEMYKRWDVEREYPENNRGINDPYKIGRGRILESFYKKEELNQQLKDARKRELELEDAYNRFKELEKRLSAVRKRKNELEELEVDIRTRQKLQPKIIKLEKDIQELKDIQRSWPIKENRSKELAEELEELNGRLLKLRREQELASKAGERERLKKRLDDIVATENELRMKQEELKGLIGISKEDLDLLEAESLELRELQMVLNAGSLSGKLVNSPNGVDIYFSEGFDEGIKAAEGEQFSAKGILTIKSSDGLEIRISAGEKNLEESAAKIRELKDGIDSRLKYLQLESLQEARSARSKQTMIEEVCNRLDERLKILLGDDSREGLEKTLEELKGLDGLRDAADIEKEIDELNNKIIEKRVDRKSIEDTLISWKESFSSQDGLMDQMIDMSADVKLVEKELEGIKGLPEEFSEVDEFFAALGTAREDVEGVSASFYEAREAYVECERNLPETSFEELQTEFKSAQESFNRLLDKGEALLRIREAFKRTKEKLDGDTDKPLVQSMSKYMRILTQNSYDISGIGESMDVILERVGSVQMPIELLSTGTRDSVGLALRLALAENLLKDSKGILVLDDCLVDMDPQRKDMAVRMIREFAESHQVIFTTCSPDTASQLKGNIIEVGQA
ncbi:AAA family ATPase [Gudongella sp. SC589]|uniref:AAA family ATPase n=1 Tax=Gudongella sp. SC589 TaxID=3385990 RepID=UPI00390481B2